MSAVKTREAACRLGARPQAEPRRAPEAGEGAARHPRRAAGADRGRLRERRRGGRRPPPVVGPLPRQAEDRDVHAAREGAGRQALAARSCARSARPRTSTAAATASSRRGRTSSSTGSSSRSCPTSSRTSRPPGITTAGGCGDTVRNITGCPVQGLAADELFDCTADRRRGGRALLRQPRLGEPAAQAQVLDRRVRRPLQRARDQLHLARRRDHDDGREGFAVLVGGGLSSVPRIARDMGVFVPKEEANEILGAITSRLVGGPQLPRLAREGAAQVHGRRHRPRGHARARRGAGSAASSRTSRCPPIDGRAVAPHRRARAEAGGPLLHRRAGAPRPRSRGDQMIAVADLAERFGGDVRLTRQQNFIVTDVPNESVDEAVAELERIGFPLDVNPLRGNSIACTGEPHCNFSVAETKTRLGRADRAASRRVRRRDRRPAAAPRRLPARLRAALGRRPRLPGHDRARRGRRAPPGVRHLRARRPRPGAAIGRPLFRRVPTDELDAAVEGLIARLARRSARERRDVRRVRAPADRRRARRARRPRAGEGHDVERRRRQA